MPTNTKVFLRGLKLFGESRTYSKRTVKYKAIYGGFFFFFFQIEALLSLKIHVYPQFSFWIPSTLAMFCFLRIVLKNRAKISLY